MCVCVCVRVCLFVCVRDPSNENSITQKYSVLVLCSTHRYTVDIIERTYKIITAYKNNTGACHERKKLPKKTVYVQANVRASGTKAHSGSVLAKRPQILSQMSRDFFRVNE